MPGCCQVAEGTPLDSVVVDAACQAAAASDQAAAIPRVRVWELNFDARRAGAGRITHGVDDADLHWSGQARPRRAHCRDAVALVGGQVQPVDRFHIFGTPLAESCAPLCSAEGGRREDQAQQQNLVGLVLFTQTKAILSQHDRGVDSTYIP